jgi:hypothetical protein
MLLLEFVLSNTDLDEKTDQIQITVSKRKYKNVEYDDSIIEYLMKYQYAQICLFNNYTN